MLRLAMLVGYREPDVKPELKDSSKQSENIESKLQEHASLQLVTEAN